VNAAASGQRGRGLKT